MTDDVHPALRETVMDRAQATLRSITSLVDVAQPGLGSIFGELVHVILPENREQRMAMFVTCLDRRMKDVQIELADMFRDLDAEQLALLEDGLRASARATQERRIEQIAALVTSGVAERANAERQRSILDLLGTLSDYDIVYLSRYANWRGIDDDRSSITTGQMEAMSETERREFNLRRQENSLSKNKLIAAGLLRSLLTVKMTADAEGEGGVVLGKPRLTEFGEYFCLQLGIWKDGERRLFPRN